MVHQKSKSPNPDYCVTAVCVRESKRTKLATLSGGGGGGDDITHPAVNQSKADLL